MHLDFLYDFIGRYGLYAVFLLVMIEGDITLLLAVSLRIVIFSANTVLPGCSLRHAGWLGQRQYRLPHRSGVSQRLFAISASIALPSPVWNV